VIILGIGVGHDTAACVLSDGVLIANAAEERFSRIKHDSGFPDAAIAYCLKEAGITAWNIDVVAIGGQFLPPSVERRFVLTREQEQALAAARPVAAKALQLLVRPEMRDPPLYFPRLKLSPGCKFLFVDHHLCHAAAAYFTRGARDPCLVVTLDGVGEDVSTAIWRGERNNIVPLARWGREGSLGLFYGIVTEALGWQHGDAEGTTMALAPYGAAHKVGDRLAPFCPSFSDGHLDRPHDFGNGSVLNKNGCNHWHFADADAIASIAADCGRENVAACAQDMLETQVLDIVRHWAGTQGLRRLACAGGVFLNVKLNQRIWYEAGLEEHWIFPDAGDTGLAVGAVLHAWHALAQPTQTMRLEHLYYGPGFADDVVREILHARRLRFRETQDPVRDAAHLLADGKMIGWFQGRMECGPRALGNRSILMSPISPANKDILNARVKFRETFRPFSPSIAFEHKDEYLIGGREENFMITSFRVTAAKRDAIAAVVHVDGTLRPQTIKRETNPLYHRLIDQFGRLTGEYAVLNTSFNVKGEPIVCHPREAIRCFFDNGLDTLVIGKFILEKPGARTAPINECAGSI
jgi:carbamoyltransferase